MTLLASRNKLVTFRLTPEEYAAIRTLCISRGTRSISEMTREALLRQLTEENATRALVSRDLLTLVKALEHIDEALKELSSRISNILGPSSKRADFDAVS